MNFAQRRRVIVAGMIGNVLEWYDFAVYGFFAAAIGQEFFPHQDRVAQLLSAFGVFALGYLMRPLGGAITGHIGDRYGRRAALTFSVVAMAIPTFLMGLLPGYGTLGLLAPIALTLLRMVQGLSVGGEYTSSVVFLVEQAPDGQRGLMGALTVCGAVAGVLLGSAVGAAFTANMSAAELQAWGWRIPFLLGLVVGVGGYVVRRHMSETIVTPCRERAPIAETLHDHWRTVLGFAGLSVFNAVGFYVSFVYLAFEPSVGVVCATGATGSGADSRALSRLRARHFGGSGATEGALYGGSFRLQRFRRDDRWGDTACCLVASRTHRG
jgi:MFS transporter, MHS family, proline/betaine transporter